MAAISVGLKPETKDDTDTLSPRFYAMRFLEFLTSLANLFFAVPTIRL